MIHIVQDECAPDGFKQFTKEVLEQTGFFFNDIDEEMVLRKDLGDTLIYEWGGFTIKNEIGIYSIKTDPDYPTAITLKVTLENGKWLVNDKTTDNLSSLELRFLDMFFAEMKNLHHD